MIGSTFLGRYEAVRLLGEGGMGRVYLAKQIDLGRQVVVKVMNERVAADPKFRERFHRESLLMARFQHPNAVTLYDASLTDPLGPCIIMEYVKGVNLDVLLKKNGRFTASRVGRLLNQLCDALGAAHELGIIHRDLKPANLMIVDADTPRERLKVMDFGLAKVIDASELRKVTDANVEFAIGTPGYICPEQIRGDTVDHRGDIYSVGVILYELLTGRLPFNGHSSMDLMLQHLTEPPPSFGDLGLEDWIPEPVEQMVMSCLAKDPSERPSSARQLAEGFEVALSLAADSQGERHQINAAVSNAADTTVVMEDKPFAHTFAAPADDPDALVFSLEAWMPQKVALLKLRGFVHDVKGTVVHSEVGLLKVKLPGPPSLEKKSSSPLAWLGLGRKPGPITMEIRLTQPDPTRETKLHIDVVFRPAPGTSSEDQYWRSRCVQVYIEFRGYMIGATDAP